MKNYPQIAARVLNTPLLLEPNYARVFFSALSSRLGITQLEDAQGQILTGEKIRMSAESWMASKSKANTVTRTRTNRYGEKELLYNIVDGAAIIRVKGTLVHKFGHLNPYSGMTGYDGIVYLTKMAFSDLDAKGVILDLDTPGGEVAGCFDTARILRQLADEAGKPLWALCYDMNCSAGMALASAAHRRLITQTGVAGSVGVVMAHQDVSGMYEEAGVKVTLIHSGAHKIDGNPYQALPENVLNQFQSNSDRLRSEFAQLVADHTGLTMDAVLATEAATYRGQEAIDVGFADELVNGHEAIAAFTNHLSSQGRTITLGATMPKEQAADLNTAPAQASEGTEPATATVQTTAQAERARIKAIMKHEAAATRTQLAAHLAYETDMTAEQAGAVLSAAGEETDERLDAGTSLDSMMQNEEQPNISANVQDDDLDPTSDEAVVAGAMAAYRIAKGVK